MPATLDFSTSRVAYTDIVGCVIAKRRELASLSQAKLASLAGMSKAPLGKIEQGKVVCSTVHLVEICQKGLRMLPHELLKEADEHMVAGTAAGFRIVSKFSDLKEEEVYEEELKFGPRIPRVFIYPVILLGPAAWPILRKLMTFLQEVGEVVAADERLGERLQAAYGDTFGQQFFESQTRKSMERTLELLFEPWVASLIKTLKANGTDLPAEEANNIIVEIQQQWPSGQEFVLLIEQALLELGTRAEFQKSLSEIRSNIIAR